MDSSWSKLLTGNKHVNPRKTTLRGGQQKVEKSQHFENDLDENSERKGVRTYSQKSKGNKGGIGE